eukprot:564634_1
MNQINHSFLMNTFFGFLLFTISTIQMNTNWNFFFCNHGGEIIRNKNDNGKGFTHRCKGPKDANDRPQWNTTVYATPGISFSTTAVESTCPCSDHKNANIHGCFVPVFGNEKQLNATIGAYKFEKFVNRHVARKSLSNTFCL